MQSCYKGIYKSDGMRGGIGREWDVQRYTYGDQPRENRAELGKEGSVRLIVEVGDIWLLHLLTTIIMPEVFRLLTFLGLTYMCSCILNVHAA